MLALLQILFPVAGQEPFWASATPGHVTIGRHVLVSVAGSGFLIGAQDYECRFETTIVNPLIGEFNYDMPFPAMGSSLAIISRTEGIQWRNTSPKHMAASACNS